MMSGKSSVKRDARPKYSRHDLRRGVRITHSPSRSIRTSSQANRYSFGIRTAWLRPVVNTLAVARLLFLSAIYHGYIAWSAEKPKGPGRNSVRRTTPEIVKVVRPARIWPVELAALKQFLRCRDLGYIRPPKLGMLKRRTRRPAALCGK
jgi:hypothetical protein